MLEKENREVPLKTQTELLSISYSSLFYQPALPSERELTIKKQIDRIYTERPYYGSRKIQVALCAENTFVSRPTVQAYMREMGLAAIVPGPNTSKPAPEHKIYPYLLRNITAKYPNHIWGIDITYIPMSHGWMYLVAVLDWYSRYVVSWELSQTLELDFVLKTVDQALSRAQPEIWNSDQGSHFTSPRYLERLENLNIKISMDGRGRAMDNIFTERLWRSVKYEEVYLHEYLNPKEAYRQITDYFCFYNFQRPHQALDYQTPAQLYEVVPALPVLQSPQDTPFPITCQVATGATLTGRSTLF